MEGKRIIRERVSRKEAEREAARIRARHRKIGTDAARLTEAQLRDAARAIEILDGVCTLAEVAEFRQAHGAGEGGTSEDG